MLLKKSKTLQSENGQKQTFKKTSAGDPLHIQLSPIRGIVA